MPNVVPAIMESLSLQTLQKLDLTAAIAHPGENGHARENILRDFVTTILPSSYEASTGFVFDSSGEISRQVDLVIYRRDYAPVFSIGGVHHFMVEAVAAVMEIKAAVDSQRVLDQAVQNIRSVKALDRTGRGKNYVLHGNVQGPHVNPDQFDHQVFGAIVTEASLTPDILHSALTSFFNSNPRRVWPNLYVDVRRFSAAYSSHLDGAEFLQADATKATHFALSQGPLPPLLDLARYLLDFLRVAEILDYQLSDYLPNDGTATCYPLPAGTPLVSQPPHTDSQTP